MQLQQCFGGWPSLWSPTSWAVSPTPTTSAVITPTPSPPRASARRAHDVHENLAQEIGPFMEKEKQLAKLPDDAWHKIASHLSDCDMVRLSMVNTQLRGVVRAHTRVRAAHMDGGYLYTGHWNGKARKTHTGGTAAGCVVWECDHGGVAVSALHVDRGYVYTSGRSGKTRKIDAETGKVVWEFDHGEEVHSVYATGNYLYTISGGETEPPVHHRSYNRYTGLKDKDGVCVITQAGRARKACRIQIDTMACSPIDMSKPGVEELRSRKKQQNRPVPRVVSTARFLVDVARIARGTYSIFDEWERKQRSRWSIL